MNALGWTIVLAGGALVLYAIVRSAKSKPPEYSPKSLGFAPPDEARPEPEVPDSATRPAHQPYDPSEEDVVIPPDKALPPPKPKLLPPSSSSEQGVRP